MPTNAWLGTKAMRERGDAHQHQCGDQCRLTADAVAIVVENRWVDRPAADDITRTEPKERTIMRKPITRNWPSPDELAAVDQGIRKLVAMLEPVQTEAIGKHREHSFSRIRRAILRAHARRKPSVPKGTKQE